MLIVKNKNIKDIKYNSLVLYALLRCDAIALKISDFYTKITSETRSDEFLEYKKGIDWRLEGLEPYLLKKYTDNKYVGSEMGYYSEIYVVQLCLDMVDNILATDGLFSWKYPDMPEDLCFFSKGKCWMKSVAHENICWIYTDSEVEKDILRKVIGLKFEERTDISEDDAPTLEYHSKDCDIHLENSECRHDDGSFSFSGSGSVSNSSFSLNGTINGSNFQINNTTCTRTEDIDSNETEKPSMN